MAEEQPPSSKTPRAGVPEAGPASGSEPAPESARGDTPDSERERRSSSPPSPPKSRSLRPPPRAGAAPQKAPPPPPKSGSGKKRKKAKPAPAKTSAKGADSPEKNPKEVEGDDASRTGSSPPPLPSSAPPPPSSVPPRPSPDPGQDDDAAAADPGATLDASPEQPREAAEHGARSAKDVAKTDTVPPPPEAEASAPTSKPTDEARQRKRQKAQELDPERLKDARMIAALHLSDDDLLPAFRRQRLGKRSRVSLEHLVMARDIVIAVVDSLRVDDRDQWERLRDAHELLFSRETMVPDPPTQIDDGWLNETPVEPTPADRPTDPQHADSAALAAAATPAGGVPAAGWAPSPASWGQAYAPGSLPADSHEEMTPPRGITQPAQGRAFAGYAEPGGYDVPPPTGNDGPPTALMHNVTQTLDPAAFDALMAAHGYEAPPPPSERTAPHRTPDPAPSPDPPPVRPASSVPPRSREEDSATHQLSFTSRAHPLALSLEEFAAYCAERDHDPERSLATAHRYEMADERVAQVVARSFELRFARDPQLRRRWQRAYEHFSEVLRHAP